MFKDNDNIYHIYGEELLQNNKLDYDKIIDIREDYEIKICKIPNTLHIPMNTLITNIERFLDKEETYYILCHHGHRSYYVTQILQDKGYNCVNIIGGIASIDQFNVPY